MNIDKMQIIAVPPWFPPEDGLGYFGLTSRRIWNLIAERKINAVKDGNLWKVEAASIFKYFKQLMNIKEDSNNGI